MYQQYQRPSQFGGPPSGAAVSTPALLGQVLGITGVGFVVTAIAASFTASLHLPSMASFIAMIVGFGFLLAISGTRANPGLSLLMFYAFTACEGVGIGPVIAAYTQLDGPSVVVDAAATTAMGMIVLGAIAFLTSFDYRRLSGIAFGMLIGLVIVSLIGAFTHFFHPGVIAWATLAVFAVLTLVDFARIKNSGSGLGPVQLATSIYLDAINIFLALLQIFGGRSRDD
jgi:modulator of FtsH protease